VPLLGLEASGSFASSNETANTLSPGRAPPPETVSFYDRVSVMSLNGFYLTFSCTNPYI